MPIHIVTKAKIRRLEGPTNVKKILSGLRLYIRDGACIWRPEQKKKMSGTVAMHSVFVYGSLMADDVVRVLLNRVPLTASAILPDFHRFSIKGRVYPAILPAEADKVNGKVLFGITDDELYILDEFEDIEYERENVQVLLTDSSEKLQTKTYVWAKKDDPDLYATWEFEEWKQLHMEGFLNMTKEFAQEIKFPESET